MASELSDDTLKSLEKLGFNAEAAANANKKLGESSADNAKGLVRQAMEMAAAHKAAMIAATKELRATGLQGNALTQAVKAQVALTEAQEDAAAQEDASIKRSQSLDKQREDGMKKLLGSVSSLGSSAMAASSSFYTSKDIFTSVIPVLDLMGGVAKTAVEAVGLLASGASIAGFSLGRMTEAAAKIISAGIDVALAVGKQQLELSQSYYNTYKSLASAGVTFGGRLTEMSQAAHNSGQNIQMYGDFVKKNISQLALMGGTVEDAAGRVAKMTMAATQGNDKMLLLYGGFDNVNDALAGYNSLLAQTGYNTVKNQDKINGSSQGYLQSLKELQELTGQSVSQQQKVQEEAQKDLAYRMMLGSLRNSNQEAKALAIEENYRITLATRGKSIADYYKEYETTNGRVISESSLMIQAQSGASVDYVKSLSETTALSKEARLQEIANISEGTKARFNAEVKASRELMVLGQYGGADGPYITAMKDRITGLLTTSNLGENTATTIAAILESSRKPIDEAGRAALALELKANENKIAMDTLIASRMKDMAKFAGELAEMQRKLITTFGDKLTGAVMQATTSLIGLATKLDEFIKGTGTTGKSFTPSDSKLVAWDIARLLMEKGAAVGAKMLGTGAGAPAPTGGASGAPTATGGASGSWGAPATTGGASGATASLGQVRDLISSVESQGAGGYNATVKQGTQDLTSMSIADIIKNGPALGAAGKYQFISETLKRMAEKTNMDPSTLFTSDVQDKLANQLIKDMGYDKYASGAMDKSDFLAKLASTWRGLPNAPGTMSGAKTDNVGNKAGVGWDAALAKLAKGGITNGPSIAGEAGAEAVIPLPDGRTVPVKMDVGELVSKLQELIDVTKDHRDTSERIYQATA
jgi:muramidase (phage lysozyme)